jgi:hypothetical protein
MISTRVQGQPRQHSNIQSQKQNKTKTKKKYIVKYFGEIKENVYNLFQNKGRRVRWVVILNTRLDTRVDNYYSYMMDLWRTDCTISF